MNEGQATQPPKASAKECKRYPPTERGVRVRIYPFEDQETVLIAKCRARAIIWNWTCDVFDRTRAKALGEDPRGLAIKCTQSAVGAEIERLRRDPASGWLRKTLTLWSCKRVVKQAFAARKLVFSGHAEHPRGRAFRTSAPMTFCVAYDGRKSDEHYVADKAHRLARPSSSVSTDSLPHWLRATGRERAPEYDGTTWGPPKGARRMQSQTESPGPKQEAGRANGAPKKRGKGADGAAEQPTGLMRHGEQVVTPEIARTMLERMVYSKQRRIGRKHVEQHRRRPARTSCGRGDDGVDGLIAWSRASEPLGDR